METTQAPERTYPGMVCTGIEFFKKDNQVKIVYGGNVRSFTETPYAVIEMLRDALHREIDSSLILKSWHPESPIRQMEQFAWCRFGGLDYQADIKDNRLQDGEYHACPKRGFCPGEGILCKLPLYNSRRLSTMEVRLMKLLSGADTNEVIAEKMEIPLGSLHQLKKELYELLGIQTKQELAGIARDLNIV